MKFLTNWMMILDRKKVSACHKAGVMKLGDGLFIRKCQEVARLYPEIEYEEV